MDELKTALQLLPAGVMDELKTAFKFSWMS
jgi:hypothetical protein